MNPTKMVVPVP